MSLSNSIKVVRQKAFYTQEELAKELNVALSTVNRWETGKARPNLSALKGLKEFCAQHDLSFANIENDWFDNR